MAKAQAINAGDFLLMLPQLVITELHSPVRADLGIIVGPPGYRSGARPVERDGLAKQRAIRLGELHVGSARKTGALLALPAYGALRLARQVRRFSQRIAEVFQEIGVLFQLQDDLVDLYGDKGREEVGCDIYEGKIGALVVAQLECSPRSRPSCSRFSIDLGDLTSQDDVALSVRRSRGARVARAIAW